MKGIFLAAVNVEMPITKQSLFMDGTAKLIIVLCALDFMQANIMTSTK